MDLYLIDSTIDELEHGETTFANCERLAALYIIKEHFKEYPVVLKGLYDEVEDGYFCEAPIDQDAWERLMEGSQKDCPYYIEDGEYKTVNKQI